MAGKRRQRFARKRAPRSKRWRLRDILAAVATWFESVHRGADPIEAMHGHVCGPGCWHQMFNREIGVKP